MMPREYKRVCKTKLRKVYQDWKNREIKFEISGVDLTWHDDPSGGRQCIVCLRIVSKDLFSLRVQLDLDDRDYRPHIAVLEKEA